MALSNIFREPRRKITELLVGSLALVPLPFFGHWFAISVMNPHGSIELFSATIIGCLIGVIAIVAVLLILSGIHAIGEIICDSLADRGFELRPKERK